jgi:PAS domain S-box-containing protein
VHAAEEPVAGGARSAARLRLLRSVTRELLGVSSVDEMAAVVVRELRSDPGIVSARVYLRDGDFLRSIAWTDRPTGSGPFELVPIDADLPAAEVARSGRPVHGEEVARLYEDYPELAARAPYSGEATYHLVPLRIQGVVGGLLVLTFAAGDPVDADRREFATTLGDSLAQALGRALAAERVEAQRQGALAFLSAQTTALVDVVAGRPLVPVLEEFLGWIETASGGEVAASVLLADNEAGVLRHGAAVGLPADYNAAVDGLEIGPTAGTCGTAAYLRERVIVDDIETDPLWDDYRQLARDAGVRACWSTPLIGSDDDLLGTLAFYHRTPRRPEQEQLEAMDAISDVVRLVIEHSRRLAGVRSLEDEAARQLRLELAVSAGGVGTFDWDLAGGNLRYDEQLLEIFGLEPRDRRRTIEDFFASVHPGDVDRVRAQLQRAVDDGVPYDAEYRIALPGGGHRWVAARGRVVRDRHGTPVRLVGAAQDTTARMEAEARVARVMDSLSTAFFFLDRDWRFTFLNGEAERVLGRSRDELLGAEIWQEFPASVGSGFEHHYRLAQETGEPVAFDAYYPAPLDAWFEVRAWPNPDGLAVYFIDITERHRAHEAAQRAIGRAGLLARVSEELAGTVEPDDAMRRLAGVLIPALGDWCTITLVDDDRHAGTRRGLGRALGWHADPALRDVADEYARTRLEQMTNHAVVVRAIETGAVQVANSTGRDEVRRMFQPGAHQLDLLDAAGIHSFVVLPLSGQEQPVGLLSVVNGAERGEFTDEDVDLLREIAARAGQVLDRARLYRQQRDVAETLQRSLLRPPQSREDLEISVAYVPAAEVARVGGDWYDAFNQPDGSTTLIIGDVMGHDLLAAAAMSETRTLIRTLAAQHGGDPARTLDDAERVMRLLDLDTLATLLVARIEAGTGAGGLEVSYSIAGHPPPLVLHRDGTVEVLDEGPVDALLGIDQQGRRQRTRSLEAGAILVLYTDGLVERRDQAVDDGIALLCDTLEGLVGREPDEVRDAILARMLPERAEDDVALLVVRVSP